MALLLTLNNYSLAAKNGNPHFSSFEIRDDCDHSAGHFSPDIASPSTVQKILK
jgi:hypothetical protein